MPRGAALAGVEWRMRRLPGKYLVLAMLLAFLLVAVFVVVVTLATMSLWSAPAPAP